MAEWFTPFWFNPRSGSTVHHRSELPSETGTGSSPSDYADRFPSASFTEQPWGAAVQNPYLLHKQEFKLKSKRVIIQQGEKEQLNSLQLLYAQLQLDSFEQFDAAEQ